VVHVARRDRRAQFQVFLLGGGELHGRLDAVGDAAGLLDLLLEEFQLGEYFVVLLEGLQTLEVRSQVLACLVDFFDLVGNGFQCNIDFGDFSCWVGDFGMSSVPSRFLHKITQVRPSWSHSTIQVNQITCALSNKVYCVSSGKDKLLLRIYGSSEHGLFSRDEEVRQSCMLSSLGFGASVLSTFEEGRIESWINGKSPSHDFMRSDDAIPVIARKLRKLHDETGLNHNDLHHNNMLFTQDGEVEFLDFEYSSPADPTYDIANHFNEWMYDYRRKDYPYYHRNTDKYPSRAEQQRWVRTYVATLLDQQQAAF